MNAIHRGWCKKDSNYPIPVMVRTRVQFTKQAKEFAGTSSGLRQMEKHDETTHDKCFIFNLSFKPMEKNENKLEQH